MAKVKNDGYVFYNPKKIKSMTDLDGNEPSIYLISTNRSAGKTTGFIRDALDDFINKGEKAIFLYRHKYEISSTACIFEDVLSLYPELGKAVTAAPHANGLFYELFLDGESFAYSMALHNPDPLKKYSPMFTKVKSVIMDEFQPENGKYLTNEIEKLQSVLLTIARGGGEQSRAIKCYLLGNMVTLMNPYFIYFGIHKRLKADTVFLRGNGWIAEFGFNEAAAEAIKQNGISRAFSHNRYLKYSTEKVYLFDADVFIDKPKGRSTYLATIVHNNIRFGVREYYDEGMLLINKKADSTCKTVVTFKAGDHAQNTIMLSRTSYIWKNINDAFKAGFLRFDDMETKNAIFDIIAVDIYR